MISVTARYLAAGAAAGLIGVAGIASAGMLTVPPDRLPHYWILSASATEVWVPNHGGKNMLAPGCASASYMIGSDGKTRDITLEKVVPASGLGQTVVQAVEHFQYRPGPDNDAQRPVRTYYTAQFNMRDFPDAKKAELTAACDLAGYGSPPPPAAE